MDANDIFDLSRFLTGTNSASVLDADLYTAITERDRQVVLWLAELKEGFNETTSTENLVASQESYDLPDTLKLKRIEVTFDGSNWNPVTVYDINQKTSLANDETSIEQNFHTGNPFGEISGEKLFLRPIPESDVTAGLKFWHVAMPSAISTASDTPTAPSEYHRYLADLLVIDIKQMKGVISGAGAKGEEEAVKRFIQNQASPRITQQDQVMTPMNINYK